MLRILLLVAGALCTGAATAAIGVHVARQGYPVEGLILALVGSAFMTVVAEVVRWGERGQGGA